MSANELENLSGAIFHVVSELELCLLVYRSSQKLVWSHLPCSVGTRTLSACVPKQPETFRWIIIFVELISKEVLVKTESTFLQC